MFKFFQRSKAWCDNDLPQSTVDTSQLDSSLELLKSATADVSQAASQAADALKQLQESEHRFLSTIDTVDDLVIIKDAKGRWLLLNRWGQDLYQWHHGEFYHKTDAELALLYPVYADSLRACIQSDLQAWSERKSYRSNEIIPRGGSTCYLDVIKTPVFNVDGSKKELIVVGRDVTAVEEKNKRTKACFHALNSASDIIFIVDYHGKVFFCNDPFLAAFEISSYENVVDKPIDYILPDLGQYTDMWEVVLSNRIWEGLYRETYKATVLPVMNGMPKPIYYVCTLKPR